MAGNIELKKSVVEQAAWDTDVDLREDYSGRGMYGDVCFGVVGDTEDLERFETELAKAATIERLDGTVETSVGDVEGVVNAFVEELEIVRKFRREDSMGMSRIYYYPHFTVVD